MRRLFVFLILFVPWNFVFAKATPPPYCEGHERKVISSFFSDALFGLVQAELDRYSAAEYNYNGRYEICLEIGTSDGVLPLADGQTLQITNTSTREVVIGFLNATRTDNSTTPNLSVHGSKVTIFQPTFSNVKKAIVFNGNRHKLIGGTINCLLNQADSLGIDGTGNNIEIKGTTVNDCTSGIALNGNRNKIENVSIAFSRELSMPSLPPDDASPEEIVRAIQPFGEWINSNFLADGTCLNLSGSGGTIKNVNVRQCDGVSLKLSGSRHSVLNSQILGQPIPKGADLLKNSTDCLFLQEASNIALEGNTFSNCQKGVHVVDSQSINIGPECPEGFAVKRNDIHRNDYAIHAENSQQVYARCNTVHDNGEGVEESAAYTIGLWLVNSNLLAINGNGHELPAPSFFPSVQDIAEEDVEVSAVHVEEINGNKAYSLIVRVPVETGVLEFSYPNDPDRPNKRYQPQEHFGDCSFENASPSPPPSPIEGEGAYVVRCPIQLNESVIGKKLIVVLHENPVGSSPPSEKLGKLDWPTGIPVSGPAPTTGNMTGGAGGSSGGSAAELITQTQVDHASQGGGGPSGAGGCGGSINPAKSAFPGLLLVLLLSLALCFYARKSL